MGSLGEGGTLAAIVDVELPDGKDQELSQAEAALGMRNGAAGGQMGDTQPKIKQRQLPHIPSPNPESRILIVTEH